MTEIVWNKTGGEVWDRDDEIHISETPTSPVLSVTVNELDALIFALKTMQQERDIMRDNWLEKHQ